MKRCQICDPKNKIEQVMHEYKEGKLHSGSKQLVTTRKQAVAIGLSESRKMCSCKNK